MTTEIEIGVDGRAGVITLTRERAINALSGAMIAEILVALEDWEDDPSVAAVVIEGQGPKGFCAGGDVRTSRELSLAGRRDEVRAYFEDEYRMNGLIASYRKPIIALQHGFVMGGGIGLSSHARYRVAAASSRFAMPEAAIGFFCDVGVNAILYQTPEHRALAFLMSGVALGPGDAIALGLTDAMVPDSELQGLRQRIIEAALAIDPDTAIAAIIAGESQDPDAAAFCQTADSLRLAFENQPVPEIVANLASLASDGDPAASALHQAMATHCPTSLEVIAQSHRLARKLRDTDAILALDLDLAAYMAPRPDFAEGVRAALVDKDRAPRWSPASLADVDRDGLEAVFAPHIP
ncbi:enoyl-CoA hydratase/isomerase family protein [Pelagibacterium limicola]|uniref:enoyl-CoA hydratase/isomerase family protein n=1 Tax=Pelagibacterium limicola TaxID=2791022 RepID=UPI0018AFF290|nr:enoyl-CoA hydratase/isomerase family protein [Pelagibacterium limicola]